MMPEIFQKGTLYLCPTPIGNLEDITYRTVRCLREADLIAAEDTRHTKQLLLAYDIDTPLTSYHEHNKAEKGPQLIEKLKDGLMIALVSDAGMPAICDPGSDMVRLALEADIPIVPLPGANAGLTGLIASGMDTTRFTFVGFLPKTQKHRLPVLESVKAYEGTLIFYEAPHRIQQVLGEMLEVLGDRRAVLCRELTKKHETAWQTTIEDAITRYEQEDPKGECVLVIEGRSQKEIEDEAKAAFEEISIEEHMKRYEDQGIARKEAMKLVGKDRGVTKRDIYQYLLGKES